MKTALAFVCSLLILWTQFVQAGTSGAGVVSSAPSCCCATSCCSADIPQPGPQPVSAAPGFSFSKNLLPAQMGVVLVWILPAAPVSPFSVFPEAHLPSESAPLYDWTCALLI